MDRSRWARKVFWQCDRESKWGNRCKKIMRKMHLADTGHLREVGLRMVTDQGAGYDWNAKKWKSMINKS